MQPGVLRTWWCQNGKCEEVFDAWENYPACPKCGCVRTSWVPRGGHIGSKATGIDATFRSLADAYGMTDIAPARAGERSMPGLKQPAAHELGPQHQFAPGFVGRPYDIDAAGNYRAVCQPSSSKVDFKVKAQVGKRLASSGNVPGPSANAQVEASYKG